MRYIVFLLLLIQPLKVRAFSCYGCQLQPFAKEYWTIMSYYFELDDKASSLRRMPFDLSNYIVQGLTFSGDDLYLTYYYKDKDGNNPNRASSIVVRYDHETFKIKGVWKLKKDGVNFTNHVSGIIVIGDKFVIVSGRNFLFFEKDAATIIENNGDYSTRRSNHVSTVTTELSPSIKINAFSFVSRTNDHQGVPVAWVGQFKEDAVETQILGYVINGSTISATPKYIFEVPAQVYRLQGVALLSASSGQYKFALARSYGDNPSYVYRLNYSMSGLNSTYTSRSTVFTGPAGMENMHPTEDGVWSISESGANFFQKRSNPWSDYFPFIFRLKKNKLL